MASDKKDNIFSDIPVVNSPFKETFSSPLDLQQTTLENAVRLTLINTFSPTRQINDIHEGVITSIIDTPSSFLYNQNAELEKANRPNYVPRRYKVGINSDIEMIPAPTSFDAKSSPENSRMLNSFEEFMMSPSLDAPVAVGMRVRVNIKTKTIEEVFGSGVNKSASNTQPPPPSSAHTGQGTQTPAQPINIDKIPDTITEAFPWTDGKRGDSKIKLKYVVSYGGALLRDDVADKFNQMCKDAANQDIKIVAKSGFRSQETQISLFNERYTKQYTGNYKNDTDNNPESALGIKYGVAAYPGYSNHQNGTAVDIDIGEHKEEKNRYAGDMGRHPVYLWMKQNAEKYGFNNLEGQKVNEPWHWVYGGVAPKDDESSSKMADGSTGGQ